MDSEELRVKRELLYKLMLIQRQYPDLNIWEWDINTSNRELNLIYKRYIRTVDEERRENMLRDSAKMIALSTAYFCERNPVLKKVVRITATEILNRLGPEDG